MDHGLFDGSLSLDVADLSPMQWARVFLASYAERGLAGAVEVIRLAPMDVAVQLSAGLQEACSEVLAAANDA